jgi:hypothetical protein
VILAAGILTALGSLCIILGSLVQAWLSYYMMTTTPPPSDTRPTIGRVLGAIADAIIKTWGFVVGWLFVLAGGVLTLAAAIVAIIAAVR